MKATDCFYVYAHLDPNNLSIKYIGKGKGKRAWVFSTQSRYGKHRAWIRGLKKKQLKPIVVILAEGLSEQSAIAIEMEFIKNAKKVTELLNMTSGGDGISGYRFNSEQKKSLGVAISNGRQKRRERIYYEKLDKLYRKRKRKNTTYKTTSLKNAQSPEQKREAWLAALKEASCRPSVKKKRSNSVKKSWKDPEIRRKRLQAKSVHYKKVTALNTDSAITFPSIKDAALFFGVPRYKLIACIKKTQPLNGFFVNFTNNEPR